MNNKHYNSIDGLLCITTALTLFALGGLTVPASAFPANGNGNGGGNGNANGNGNGNSDQITLTGFARDFISSHPDFNVTPADGMGHYAGNVSQVLGLDGRPLLSTNPNSYEVTEPQVLRVAG